ncbi:hypothetical protein OBBRIDRAFT_347888 [Obba rivulosa]|uniref:Uncharacterized protein n=1 Tax=Obba rivulosa TaxID=1052685 RepID=A0A8E2AN24_9APHY|nr:hypothetical protein OBBRIDRAFT_347888 [Obba rivulosa]
MPHRRPSGQTRPLSCITPTTAAAPAHPELTHISYENIRIREQKPTHTSERPSASLSHRYSAYNGFSAGTLAFRSATPAEPPVNSTKNAGSVRGVTLTRGRYSALVGRSRGVGGSLPRRAWRCRASPRRSRKDLCTYGQRVQPHTSSFNCSPTGTLRSSLHSMQGQRYASRSWVPEI